jgi:hypothetical protein
MSRIFNAVALSDDELAICNQFGTDPAAFAARLADRRAGRPMVLSSHTTNRENAASGIIGPQIADEAFEQHRLELENNSTDHRQLAQEARKAIDEFLSKADTPDAWKILARASAMLTGALDRIGPAYVDRVNTQASIPGKSQSQWK